MKQKIGTVLDRNVLLRARLHASARGQALSQVIQDALERYLAQGSPEPARREAAYELFCNQPIRLAPRQFKALLEHDAWNA